MRASLILRATQHRTPSIKFLGKRSIPKSVDHSPQPHPASPTHSLPDSFATYRAKAQQHGPLGGNNGHASPFQAATSGHGTYGAIGGQSGRSLGSVQPAQGEYFDRNELPKRFWRTPWSEEEIEAVSTGGASSVF
ncbi:hypothetical protein PV10_08068 [Exophiala mesophila]|uniref:37S ribosomal protein YMR-31, mitochondrial n=1 Tax=Exophiala mesophila TaxID=212818 RepID=A0A0D1XJK4_EXOME|nr:uncharacterized protein PV10_08068 [Exophiala mesophila]KIV88381.1 hypothetical protein PV10_08068 [Exophiala mesophila]